MNKPFRTAVLTSVIALSGAFTTAAHAEGYRNEGGASASQYQGQDQQQQQQQNQGQNQGQNQTANGGHFGRPEFPWERTDKADALRSALAR